MITDLRVYIVVVSFLLAVSSLLIFNVGIIINSKLKQANIKKKEAKWKNIVFAQAAIATEKRYKTPKWSEKYKIKQIKKHQRFLHRKLRKMDNLTIYTYILQQLRGSNTRVYNEYIRVCHATFQRLAIVYSNGVGVEASIKRACFANFVYNFPQVAGAKYSPLMDKLISYIDDKDAHCRINALRALCRVGNPHAVVNALRVINDKQYYVYNKLMTNLLSLYRGNKRVFGERLWNESEPWSDNLVVAVIRYITRFCKSFVRTFWQSYINPLTGADVRTAISRYFGKHNINASYLHSYTGEVKMIA